MSLLWALPAVAVAAVAFWLYRTREPAVGGRGALAALRAAALAVVALLLVNPEVPGGPGGAPSAAWILVDGSLSMAADEGTGWERARWRARALADSLGGEGRVRLLLFGTAAGATAVSPDSLPGAPPGGSSTPLAPALERAAESGASRIHVVSDLRAADPVGVEAVLAELPAPVRLEGVGRPFPNAAVAGLELPRGVAAGEGPTARVRIAGEGGGEGDSVEVEVREEGRLVASRRVPLPGRGREVRLPVELPPPRGTGEVRYSARARLDGDAFPADDERLAVVAVDPPEGAALFLSLRPDWEPRFLLPVLRQVTGLEIAGYLRVGEDRWIPLAPDDVPGAGRTLTSGDVRRLLGRSRFLVLHGVGARTPAWVREAGVRVARLLLLPDDPAGAAVAGVTVGRALAGEWEVAGELPPSPLATELSGVGLRGLPPLGRVLPRTGEEGGRAPLRVALRGRGPGEAALALMEEGGRRRAVALASGFWRWAFREGEAREAYRRLWAAVASWLLAEEEVAAGPGVRPVSPVAGGRNPVAWTAPGLGGRAVELEVWREEEEEEGGRDMVVDTTFPIPPGGGFRIPGLEPGSYRYAARTTEEGDEVGVGRLEVEGFSDELLHPPLDTARLGSPGTRGEAREGGEQGGRPLRTHPAPYLLVLALLSAEWMGRRRRGLR